MPVQQIPASCEGCGACCYGLVVQVVEDDFATFNTPREFVAVVPDPAGGDPVLAMKQDLADHKRCLALDPESRRCTIYEERPATCRTFTRGDDPDGGNSLCFEAVDDMRTEQGRRVAADPARLRTAIRALRAVTGDDVDAASAAAKMELLTQLAEVQAGVSLTLLASLQTRAQEVEIEAMQMKRDIASMQRVVKPPEA